MRWGGIRGRLLAFNVLLVLAPTAGLLFLDSHENELLAAQERSMVEQGRVLAAALSGRASLVGAQAEHTLNALAQGSEARLRVLDRSGRVLADSASGGARADARPNAESATAPRESVLYQLGAWPVRALRELRAALGSGAERRNSADTYAQGGPLLGPDVTAALAGRYGAATRTSAGGQRSVTLYSALPIRGSREAGAPVIGVVLVSKSTYRILQALVRLRLEVLRISLLALGAAVILSLFLSRTIAAPLIALRDRSEALLDPAGRPTGDFRVPGRRANDEIGDLVESLQGLRGKLLDHGRAAESLAREVSHELRNPLASIRNAAELLPSARGREESASLVRLVVREVARCERLLEGLSELCRLEALPRSGSARTAGPACDLAEVCHGVIEAHLLRGGCAVKLFAVPARVAGPPEQLTQICENLLDNAGAFHRGRTPVEMRVEQGPGPIVRLQVLDRGPGFPGVAPDQLEQIFERFFSDRRRAQPTAESGHHSGHGLGLAIVRSAAHGMEGRVRAANRRGGGAFVEVVLPQAGQRGGPSRPVPQELRRTSWLFSRSTIQANPSNGKVA